MMDFPTKFTDEIDPQCIDLRQTNADFLAGQPWEGFIGQVGVSKLRQHIARTRARQDKHAHSRGQPFKADRAIARQGLFQIVMVMPLIRASRDKIITLRRDFIDGELTAHAALVGEQIRQGYASDLFRHRIC